MATLVLSTNLTLLTKNVVNQAFTRNTPLSFCNQSAHTNHGSCPISQNPMERTSLKSDFCCKVCRLSMLFSGSNTNMLGWGGVDGGGLDCSLCWYRLFWACGVICRLTWEISDSYCICDHTHSHRNRIVSPLALSSCSSGETKITLN